MAAALAGTAVSAAAVGRALPGGDGAAAPSRSTPGMTVLAGSGIDPSGGGDSTSALQSLIDTHQPNAAQGRNYARALGERWVEWRAARPQLCQAVESATPAFVLRRLQRWAAGGKKVR